MNRDRFSSEEWYHCYTRGIDKRKTFTNYADYERFLSLLYLCNNTVSTHRSDRRAVSLADLLSIERKGSLVGVGAFCLMPNHFHLLLREISGNGITSFMRKVGTSYAMYFNIKYERSGNLFAKPFRSRHIDNDRYLQRVLQYIHCNPAELFEQRWKQGHAKNIHRLTDRLKTYQYSSFGAFSDPKHRLRAILDTSIFEIETQLPPRKMIQEAFEYYRDVKVTPRH
ncbi:transposase [Candidatus Kaiserbacteria bacterium]|nr:transposase [Candidatus Kaiserbacteria bacterium]